jgi:hypothetical protein
MNGFFDCSGVTGSQPCFSAKAFQLVNGSVSVRTKSKVGPSSGWQIVGTPELYFEYLDDSERENMTGLPVLHLKSISNIPCRTIYALTIRAVGKDYARTVMFDGNRSTGCAFSVRGGNYTISVTSPLVEWLVGRLVHSDGDDFSAEVLGDNFYDNVSFDQFATPSRTPLATPTDMFTLWLMRPRGCSSKRMMTLLFFTVIIPDDSRL